MEVRKDFAERVAALSSSTPREAIANLLSALMPRLPTQTRRPTPPPAEPYRYEPTPDYYPMPKLTRRGPRTRKALPNGKLSYVIPRNPKKGKSAERFNGYYGMEGKSALQIIRMTSLTASDIAWDVEHRFVRFDETY